MKTLFRHGISSSLFARSHSLAFSRSGLRRVSSSLVDKPWVVRCVWSANILGVDNVRQFGKSLIYKRKNNGPSTDPCGTPHLIWEASDKQLLAKHLCDRSCKYVVNQISVFVSNPYHSSFFNKMEWSTVSNAFFKSIKTTALSRPSSVLLYHCFVASTNAVVVEWRGRKPDCWLFNNLLIERYR